jgi:HAMP domain-containing protein
MVQAIRDQFVIVAAVVVVVVLVVWLWRARRTSKRR